MTWLVIIQNTDLNNDLLSIKEISNVFDKQQLKKIIDPTNYLGASPSMAQKLLDKR